jgi:hypothetical protein
VAYLFLSTLSVPVIAQEAITTTQLEYWNRLIGEGTPTDVFLGEVQAGAKEHWPRVVSSRYASPMDVKNRARHESFREIGRQLVRRLQTFEIALRTMGDDEFSSRVTQLLTLRDHLTEQASYVNWVLADAITRIGLVNVAKRLVKNGTLVASVTALVEPLGRQRLDLNGLIGIAHGELGHPLKTTAQGAADVQQQLVVAVDLMTELAPGSLGFFPGAITTMGKIGTHDLLADRYLELLLFRSVMTDLYVHGALSRAVRYGQSVQTISYDDRYEQIAPLFENRDLQPTVAELAGGRIYGRLLATPVATLFRQVKESTIDRELLFSATSPGSGD